MPRGALSTVLTFTMKTEFSFELDPIYIYIYIYIYIEREREREESSNENSFFILNVRTTKIAPRDIFTLTIMHYSE